MKKLAALLGLGALLFAGAAFGDDVAAPSQPAAGASRSFQSAYSVTARGMNVGNFNFRFSQTGDAYQVDAQRRLQGFARMLANSSQDYSYSAHGIVAADGSL